MRVPLRARSKTYSLTLICPLPWSMRRPRRWKSSRPSSPSATSSPSSWRPSGSAWSSGSSGVMFQPRLLRTQSHDGCRREPGSRPASARTTIRRQRVVARIVRASAGEAAARRRTVSRLSRGWIACCSCDTQSPVHQRQRFSGAGVQAAASTEPAGRLADLVTRVVECGEQPETLTDRPRTCPICANGS